MLTPSYEARYFGVLIDGDDQHVSLLSPINDFRGVELRLFLDFAEAIIKTRPVVHHHRGLRTWSRSSWANCNPTSRASLLQGKRYSNALMRQRLQEFSGCGMGLVARSWVQYMIDQYAEMHTQQTGWTNPLSSTSFFDSLRWLISGAGRWLAWCFGRRWQQWWIRGEKFHRVFGQQQHEIVMVISCASFLIYVVDSRIPLLWWIPWHFGRIDVFP